MIQLFAAHGWAFAKAAVSLIALLPHCIGERYRVRTARRPVPEHTFAHLIHPPPAKAA